MTTNPYTPPATNFDTVPVSGGAPALWNPGPAGVLAFFFTPIFGAIIIMKNWEAMGENEKARQSKMWAIGSVVFYAALLAVSAFLPDTSMTNVLGRGAAMGYFVAWYMKCCKDHKDVVTSRFGTAFPKRGWTMPLLYAVGVYVGAVVAFIAVIAVFGASEG